MAFSDDVLRAAHKHCARHRGEVLASDLCGCFYCRATYPPAEIGEWTDWLNDEEEPQTAICPHCGIDAVIGDASGYPVEDPLFRKAMHELWFERTVNSTEARRILGQPPTLLDRLMSLFRKPPQP